MTISKEELEKIMEKKLVCEEKHTIEEQLKKIKTK